jgi:diacylglycerol kinase (ATP)
MAVNDPAVALKTCVILNPNAGSVETAGEISAAIQQALAERHGEVEVRLTEKEGDGRALAAEAVQAEADLIVAVGGDGTLNEVLNGMAEGFGRVRLGLLPLGTGNDFARSIGIPADLEEALKVLAAGRTRRIDVGVARIGGGEARCFLNMSAGGFSGKVSEKADEAKERWGPLSYLRSALGALPELHGFKSVITLNGSERLELATYNIVVSNGRFVAAGIPVAPQAIVDDGMLDIMIAPEASMGQLALLLPQVLLGRHTNSDLLIFRRVTRLEIESDPPMTFNVDGELCGQDPAQFEILPRALEAVVGPEGEGDRAEGPG